MRIYIILIACVYIFNSSTLFNTVPMAQWSTHMPCNREAAGSNLSGVLAFFYKALIMKLTIVEKNLLSWTAIHIDFVMRKKVDQTLKKPQF